MHQNLKYWIIVASKDHVKNALTHGIAQTCHGKASPLKRMHKDDYIIYYSGKHSLTKPEPCQQFTAIGKVLDDDIYQVNTSEDFCPSRRNIDFLTAKDISILPLISKLNFIPNKSKWGYPFRFGMLEIDEHDFELISSGMLAEDYV